MLNKFIEHFILSFRSIVRGPKLSLRSIYLVPICFFKPPVMIKLVFHVIIIRLLDSVLAEMLMLFFESGHLLRIRPLIISFAIFFNFQNILYRDQVLLQVDFG